MARKKATASATAESPMRQLALDFFRMFGATAHANGNKGPVTVELTPALEAHFGKPALSLVFSTAELSPYHDLVAYGSRVFDRMVAYIANHGSLVRLALPNHFPELASNRLPAELTLANCDLTHSAGKNGWRYLVQFNFHISYRADDKREEIFQTALDEDGGPTPNMPDLLAQTTPAGEETATLKLESLVELAQQAEKQALLYADRQCAEIEREVLPRLHAILSRLVTYYEQQALEIQERSGDPDHANNQRETLRSDLQRKIAEELENHRLRVAATLFSLAQVAQPAWEQTLSLRSRAGGTTLKLPLSRNLFTGQMELPVCHACTTATAIIGVCAHEHVNCPNCLACCHACARDVCLECGVQGCSVCKQSLCQDCAVVCPACGQWACAEHASRCPICQETTCLACQATCAQCGVRQCQNHLVADYLAPGVWLCVTCAVTCPHCQRPTAQTATCAFCGQVFCKGCTARCIVCDQVFCQPHLLQDQVNREAVVCKNCARPCPNCGLQTASLQACAECGALRCSVCLQGCTECGTMVCADHAERCSLCGRLHCAAHSDYCHVDGKVVCTAHGFECPVCAKMVCHAHQKFCTICNMAYCPDCYNAKESRCATCEQLSEAQRVNLATEPVSKDPDIAALATAYNWHAIQNRTYVIYLGHRLIGQMLLVAKHNGDVMYTKHVKPLDIVFRWGRQWFG